LPGRCRSGSAAAPDAHRLGRQGREGPPRQEVEGSVDVDLVVALVHAGRLAIESDTTERRMPDEVAQPDLADPPGAQVLVPVEMRTALRLGVVEVDHHQAGEP